MSLIRVALDVPLHRCFDYESDEASPEDIGQRVIVPFGVRKRVGIIVDLPASTDAPTSQLRCCERILRELPPLPRDLLELSRFASAYYQAPFGTTLLQSLPSGLKKLKAVKRRQTPQANHLVTEQLVVTRPQLNDSQQAVVEKVNACHEFRVFLLHGITGSGKTEVYLRLIEERIKRGEQVLLLVPEINLTPQLEIRVRERFPQETLVTLHSDLGEATRETEWLKALAGEAQIILGTRLAVFSPIPRLGLILIDEEHDPSYKQQDGVRYSARDLAVFRAQQRQVPVLLGSATPSLESWLNAETGRYTRLDMPKRANPSARLPSVTLVDKRHYPAQDGLSSPLIEAISARLERGEQSLLFLNRRGYAPILNCLACGWSSGCQRCAAHLVVHQADQRLRCHHCGFEERIPHKCPSCGNQDLQTLGRGTQKLESWITEQWPGKRILRVDRDSARSRKQWEKLLLQIHHADPDERAQILVGTQMLAKGHDFPLLTLVGVVDADSALFSADFRAPERLLAQLMQVAGRAGRAMLPGQVIIETRYPDHPLYQALVEHDYPGFAQMILGERKLAGLPPHSYQCILRAEAPVLDVAIKFLRSATTGSGIDELLGQHPGMVIYDAVPMRMARLASLERAQVLVESVSRTELQAFLPQWRNLIEQQPQPRQLRWHLEVDPLSY